MVLLFWEFVGTLGGGTYLEEEDHWKNVYDGDILSLTPSAVSVCHDVNCWVPSHGSTSMFSFTSGPQQWNQMTMDRNL
jgi:hypothetical protein